MRNYSIIKPCRRRIDARGNFRCTHADVRAEAGGAPRAALRDRESCRRERKHRGGLCRQSGAGRLRASDRHDWRHVDQPLRLSAGRVRSLARLCAHCPASLLLQRLGRQSQASDYECFGID